TGSRRGRIPCPGERRPGVPGSARPVRPRLYRRWPHHTGNSDAFSRCRLSLLSCLYLLLVRTHLLKRAGVGDIGDRHVSAGLAVVASSLPPPLGFDGVLLAEQGKKDARLLLAKAGQPLESPEQLRPVGISCFPQRGGITVVVVDDDPGQRLDALGHRPRKPMDGRPFRAQRGELVRV